MASDLSGMVGAAEGDGGYDHHTYWRPIGQRSRDLLSSRVARGYVHSGPAGLQIAHTTLQHGSLRPLAGGGPETSGGSRGLFRLSGRNERRIVAAQYSCDEIAIWARHKFEEPSCRVATP